MSAKTTTSIENNETSSAPSRFARLKAAASNKSNQTFVKNFAVGLAAGAAAATVAVIVQKKILGALDQAVIDANNDDSLSD